MIRLATPCGALAIVVLLAGCSAKPPMGGALRGRSQFEDEWRRYVRMESSKALAVAGDVTVTHVVGYAYGAPSDEHAVREALAACEQRRGDRRIEDACWLYAVNEEVVADGPAN